MPKTVINANSESLSNYLRKIWLNRSLILTLAKRDLKIKYAQTFLGLVWTIVQPLTAVIVFTLFFTGVLNFELDYPYILFVLSGVLMWGLFQYIFSQSSNALIQNADLIRKIAFPKIILPLSKILLGLVEFGIGFIMLLIIMIYYQVSFQWKMLALLLVLIPLIMFALGIAFILSAVTLRKRDLFHIVPFIVNFGIWLTPVFYPVNLIPEKFEQFIYVNPIACSIQLFRWSFFDEALNPSIWMGLCISFIIFILGFYAFKKAEDKIIDII
jgi:lipopolysaccharide transport system permease protein